MLGIPTIPVVTKTITAATSSVTLYYGSPGGTPRHLVVRMNPISDSTGDGQTVKMRFNGDSGNNYNLQYFKGVSSTASSQKFTSRADHPIYDITDTAHNGGEVLIPDAFSTRTDKSFLGVFGKVEEGVFGAGGRWENTAAITSVTLLLTTGQFAATSTFELAVVDEAYVIDETINTGAAQFDHSSISAADGDLVIIGNLRSDVTSNLEEVSIRFNNDTGGNYLRQRINASNGTNLGAYADTSPVIAHGAGANADADSFSGLLVQIPNFSDGSNDRNALTLGGGHFSDSDQILGLYHTRWNNTTAINRVAVYGKNASSGFLANSMLSIYAVPKNQITRTELGSDTSSVTFSSIPATYDHLEVTVYARTDRSAVNDVVNMTFHTDTTTSNYDHQELQGAATTVSANTNSTTYRIGVYPAASEGSNEFGIGTTTIYNYTKTDRDKLRLTVMGSSERVLMYSRRWEDTSAINQIVLTPNVGDNFLAGSVFTLRGISATPSTSNVDDVNGIAIANVQAINGIAIGDVQEINDVENAVEGGGGSVYAGITWSTDDNFPAATRQTISSGTMGAKLNTDTDSGTDGTQFRSYEHDGSSWASGVATGGITHTSGAGGGTQGAAIMFAGYDSGDEDDSTEEYNGSSWATVNNMVQGHAYCAGGGIVQTAQLVSGGSSYNPTTRNLTMTQTYDGTNWSNESVASHGAGAGTQGESAGGGLDAFLVASGSREDPPNSNQNLISQIFNQTAGTWTTKASVSSHTWYNASGTDGTRVFKIAGMGGASVESWVDNTWTTESELPASRAMGGLGTGGLGASGAVAHVAGRNNSDDSNVNTYYKSVAT